MLLSRGNSKLGPDVWHFNLPAGPSCPGASEFCALHCYAKHGQYHWPSVVSKYASQWQLATGDLPELELQLAAELASLPSTAVVRLHTSGDFHSVDYVEMWVRLAAAHPGLRFYAYTRSWRVPELVPALDQLRQLANVKLWASTDEATGPAPAGWREATIVSDWSQASRTTIHCPEQTGRKASCSDCGICFADRLKGNAKLAFKLH